MSTRKVVCPSVAPLFAGLLLWTSPAAAASPAFAHAPVVSHSQRNDVSLPLASLSRDEPPDAPVFRDLPRQPLPRREPKLPGGDPALEGPQTGPTMPSAATSFDGVGNVNFVLPPDTNGAARRLGRARVTLSHTALSCLWTYAWPGNIRELQHVLEAAMVLSDGIILPEHLPPSVRSRAAAPAGAALPLAAAGGSLDETLGDWERRMILDALAKAGGIQARAAKLLGISERSLWYRVKKLKIQVQEPR